MLSNVYLPRRWSGSGTPPYRAFVSSIFLNEGNYKVEVGITGYLTIRYDVQYMAHNTIIYNSAIYSALDDPMTIHPDLCLTMITK